MMMKRRGLREILLSALVLILVFAANVNTAQARQNNPFCGPDCLLAICKELNVPASRDELVRLCRTDEREGTSLANLQHAAKSKGLSVVSMKMSVSDLLAQRVPAIAHLWNNHYVVVESGNGGSAEILDPSGPNRVKALAEFRDLYSGFALLVSKSAGLLPNAEAATGPDLRFDEYVHNFGFVDEGAAVRYAVKLRNAGAQDVLIQAVTPSCGCVVAALVHDRIAPGDETEMLVSLDTSEHFGPQGFSIRVLSNDPVSPMAALQLTGCVRSKTLILSTRGLDFGKVGYSETAAKQLYVPDSSEESANCSDTMLKLSRVYSASPFITAEIARSPGADQPCYVIHAALKPGAPPGEFKGKLIIECTHPKEPRVEVSVLANYIGDIEATPDRFFFTAVRHGVTARSVMTISAHGHAPLKIGAIDNPLDCLSVDMTPVVEGKAYTLTATLKTTAPEGNIRGDILVHTNNPAEPVIKVPVYAYVE